MTIMKGNVTYNLPYEISKCTGAVFIRLDDGTLYPINQDPGISQIFKKLWSCNDLRKVQLFFENNADARHIIHMLIEGKGKV